MQSNLANFTDVHLRVQKLRVATGNRMAHLQSQGRNDERAEEVHKQTVQLEKLVEGYIADEFHNHPTYPWVSRINGCGMEAAAKVIGLVEGVTFKSTGRSGIEAFDNVSKLRRFAGLAPAGGKAEKVAKGQMGLHYSPELRMMLWRLLTSLMRARGVWYEEYKKNEAYYEQRFTREGISVISTPAGRYCLNCMEEKQVSKTTMNCPDCGEKLVVKKEPPGVIFRGHLVNMAKRRTIRLWLDCLYLAWRDKLGLPVRSPYIVEYGGHQLIDPWSMVDK